MADTAQVKGAGIGDEERGGNATRCGERDGGDARARWIWIERVFFRANLEDFSGPRSRGKEEEKRGRSKNEESTQGLRKAALHSRLSLSPNLNSRRKLARSASKSVGVGE